MASSSEDMWVLSMDRLVAQNMARNDNDRRQNCSVYRIPAVIRKLRPQCYDYEVIPLGLYNRDFRDVTPMVQLELEVVAVWFKHLPDPNGWTNFCSRVAEPPPDHEGTSLEDFYHDTPVDSSITPPMVRSVLVLDAVFIASKLVLKYDGDDPAVPSAFEVDILELFRRNNIQCHESSISRDIGLVFENQVPLYLVQNVWGLYFGDGSRFEMCLKNYVLQLVLNLLPMHIVISSSKLLDFEGCNHILEYVHKAVCLDINATSATAGSGNGSSAARRFTGWLSRYLAYLKTVAELETNPGTTHSAGSETSWAAAGTGRMFRRLKLPEKGGTNSATTKRFMGRRTLPTVTELRKAGIRFRGVQTGICGIRFEKSFFNLKATLNLPQLRISDGTEKLLLNLCAFESMKVPDHKRKVTAFVLLMDELISTEEDVQLLRKGPEPVISVNKTGEDKGVANLFNILQNFDGSIGIGDLKIVIKEIHAWNDTRWRHQVTHFMDRFVIAPWIVIAMVASTILLAATLLQTVYTVEGFYHPK
ncbi:hypothetical protein R1flu_024898 [Riccia fluitans]|uniref:Uncharacterized protein n=1 Tax=Riccia fluitans TaxID=41844 RepID=A0ABD1XW83_9MARC